MSILNEKQKRILFLEGVRDQQLNIIQKYGCYVFNEEVQGIIALIRNSNNKIKKEIERLRGLK